MYLDAQINELMHFHMALGTLDSSSGKEILASLGKGVYAPSVLASNELFVEVGSGIVLKKMPAEVQEILEKQISNIRNSRILFEQELDKKIEELHRAMQELERQKGKR